MSILGLPVEVRPLGDLYARDEFRRHMKCKPEEAQVFMTAWADYCVSLAKQLSGKAIKSRTKIGAELTPQLVEQLRDEQVCREPRLFWLIF
jgi:hypothetical protein